MLNLQHNSLKTKSADVIFVSNDDDTDIIFFSNDVFDGYSDESNAMISFLNKLY